MGQQSETDIKDERNMYSRRLRGKIACYGEEAITYAHDVNAPFGMLFIYSTSLLFVYKP